MKYPDPGLPSVNRNHLLLIINLLIIFQWNAEVSIESCGYPGDPSYGAISADPSDDLLIGDNISTTCDPGYELQGSANRTCESDGDWSGDSATCTSKYQFNVL